jgi:hypothetical protein
MRLVPFQLNPQKHSTALAQLAKRVWLLPGLLLLLVPFQLFLPKNLANCFLSAWFAARPDPWLRNRSPQTHLVPGAPYWLPRIGPRGHYWSHIVGTALAAPRPVEAQNPEALLPGQSAAKAKELIQEAIHALGGQAYLNVRDIAYTGRLGQFATTGDLSGYAKIYDFVKLPDKDRTEYFKQRNIIEVYNGDQAWSLDRGGVQEIPAEKVREDREASKRDVDYVFRFRLKEEGMIFRYAGADIVDLKQVDWVEIVDPMRNTLRIAFDSSTHLPLRTVAIVRDRETRERSEEITFFSNYHPIQGVLTPLQVARERNGRKIYQVFWEECKYNTGLADSLFTRESLEQRFGELNKGKKKK